MMEDGTTIEECLDKNPSEYFCPEGYYLQPGQVRKDVLKTSWKGLPVSGSCFFVGPLVVVGGRRLWDDSIVSLG
jgi:hypothetical protein